MYTLLDFNFNLPPELIAQNALPERSASRLLEVIPNGSLLDHRFSELPVCVEPSDLLVFNDTKVLKARFDGIKESGGRVEVLIERVTSSRTALAQIRAGKRLLTGSVIRLADAFDVSISKVVKPFYMLHFSHDCIELINWYGQLPLPPYIKHKPDSYDNMRYQTIFAMTPGAIAAPTAGLHFDIPTLIALKTRGVRCATLTLHIGSGTFQPVRTNDIRHHKMHSEWYNIPPLLVEEIEATKAAGRSVIAVGTTSMRALEAAARDAERDGRKLRAVCAETDIFITPGYRFRIIDRLLTNFHLPKSTLLMLVSAFAGVEPIRRAYCHAISKRYRFFSYGDAMLLTRATSAI
ncbi:tRNA preQ1(34) S-adenosylmethionine ribosyltransferase-isomerase QueA [Candidatus Vallotia lariciata]|uniref:tRNA preQ1(34) S-adenosylmethionine ribosyltransferase-isomerase QueA n=1 Tax=Candidatus Vallotia laricis TaxID=2018052 RepID=UPI001D02ADC3|nr:tRNA preQ1(34) S-adenosylmethionine ribosyltransferase-isomerase QueA [Candidatus Vallotia lariciata]